MRSPFHSRCTRIILLPAMGLLASCTGLRYSTEERPLYTGFTVEWTEDPTYDATGAKQELEALVKPGANNAILGIRPTVALHNTIKEPKQQKGIGFLLKYKVGSAPVYLENVPLDDINAAMVNRLNNRGYFLAQSSYEVVRKGRTASVVFTVTPGIPLLIRSLKLGKEGASALDSAMAMPASPTTYHASPPNGPGCPTGSATKAGTACARTTWCGPPTVRWATRAWRCNCGLNTARPSSSALSTPSGR